MACSPATPAPSTSTSAGRTVPAAVMLSGKNCRSRPAATTAPRYPATIACELNASIGWAREIRGTSSMANVNAPRSRRAATSPIRLAVGKKEQVATSGCAASNSAVGTGCTLRTSPAPARAPGSTRAPAAAYRSSGNNAANPHPGWTATS